MVSGVKQNERKAEHDERLFFVQGESDLLPTVERGYVKPQRTDATRAPAVNDIFKPALKPFSLRQYLAIQWRIEQERGTNFLAIPVLLIAGIVTFYALPLEPALHNIPIALAVLTSARLALSGRSVGLQLPVNALLLVIVGMALAQLHTYTTGTPMLGSEVSTNLTGRIVSIEQRPNGSVRYTLDVISTERPTLRYSPTRVRATTRQPVEGAQIGQGLHGYVRLRPPSGPARPSGYDFAFNNYYQGIGANGFFLGQPEAQVLAPNSASKRPSQWVEQARLWLAKRIRSHEQTPAGTVSAALITGDKAAIPEEINEALRISGLAHILSISGLHMALVAGTVMFFLRAMIALSPVSGAKIASKKTAAIFGFGAIFIYLFLAGASVATQRSFIMLGVMLGALLSDRSALTMRNLAIAAIIVLFLAPETVMGPSFQMSFSATLALIAAYAGWTRWRFSKTIREQPERNLIGNIGHKAVQFIGGLSMTSIIAGTATGIFAAYHFQRVAVLGLVGNLLAMPLVSLITMPFAIIGTLLIPVGLDGLAFGIMNWSVEQVIDISTSVAAIAPSGAVGAMSSATLIWLSIGMLVLCLAQSKLRYLGLLLLVPAWMTQHQSELPVLVISEDARQVAHIEYGKNLRVNRTRPNGFILEQWQSAYRADDIITSNSESGFTCKNKDICTLVDSNIADSMRVYYAQKGEDYALNSQRICQNSQIIILAYAPAKNQCDKTITPKPIVITAQQLALYGSVEISRNNSDDDSTYTVKHALGKANRPWQAHRQYSRSARNLAPIERN